MSQEFIIHLSHLLIIGSLFIYIGTHRTNIPEWFYLPMVGLGVFIIIYHIYKLYLKITNNKNPWVNLIHILLVGPVLIYIGYKKKDTSRPFFEILLLLGFAAIGYHGYYLLEDIGILKDKSQ
jgi:succinate dehydrogenase hydrophobic anchor subunit